MTFTKSDSHDFEYIQDYSMERNINPIPGSHSSSFINHVGQIKVQEINSPSCTAYLSVFRMQKNENIYATERQPLLFIWLSLQEDIVLSIKGLESTHLREGQYNLFYSSTSDLHLNVEAGKECIALCLNYPISALNEMAPYFEGLASFLKHVEAGEPAILQVGNLWITKEIQESIYQIWHSPMNDPFYSIFLDLTIKILLFHLMLQSGQQQSPSNFSNYEIDGIYAARDIIRKNIRYHFIIRDIAQKVGLNEAKLKIGFRELFGNGVYEYLQSERMREARQLLIEPGRTIKEIAALTGYKSVNSFIKAFKKKYRQTPGEFRRRA